MSLSLLSPAGTVLSPQAALTGTPPPRLQPPQGRISGCRRVTSVPPIWSVSLHRPPAVLEAGSGVGFQPDHSSTVACPAVPAGCAPVLLQLRLCALPLLEGCPPWAEPVSLAANSHSPQAFLPGSQASPSTARNMEHPELPSPQQQRQTPFTFPSA